MTPKKRGIKALIVEAFQKLLQSLNMPIMASRLKAKALTIFLVCFHFY